MNPTVATREIFWQIPFSFKVAMYILMFIAIGVLIYGLYKKYKYVSEGSGVKALFPEELISLIPFFSREKFHEMDKLESSIASFIMDLSFY